MFSDVLDFWFHEIAPVQWWAADPAFDTLIRSRFGALHARAVRCELYGWGDRPEGRLAEIVVLDHFSRNMFRGDPRAFAADTLALALAQEAVARGAERTLPADQRNFVYMPYMHSESPAIHVVAVQLFKANGLADDYELRHKAIVDRFGRYPHRNAILGRESTDEELAFLKQPGSSF
ncbi:hypothetical protein GALL_425920 [mine drainage metagenome]|uniref:DUF924 domain-containing protein n=1 Tax=mine drainage metagenome TaxID=410659 RepID=A0A1J5PW26_9ZZZZ